MYLFDCQQIWKVYHTPGGNSHENVIISTAVKSRSIVKFYILGWLLAFLTFNIWIFENQVFNVSSICFRYHQIYTNKQTNKQTKITITCKEFLEISLNLKLSIVEVSIN